VLRARPLLGTLFQAGDETAPVVVLSEALWRQRFGADPALLGRLIHFDGRPQTVVGVLPQRQAYPDQQVRAWVPFRVSPVNGNSLSVFNAIGRLRSGVTASQAAAEGTARGRFAADTGLTTMAIFGSKGPVEISAQPVREALTGDVRRPLVVLLVAVALLLFTATANIASLQLARATSRRREIAMRSALGAGGLRVMRQLVVESLLVSLAGGAAGLLLAWTLHRFLPTVLPPDFPRVDDLHLSAASITFAILLAVLTGIAFGLIPALRLRRLDLVNALAADATAPVTGAAGSRARALIMSGQVAIACVLLIGASLLGRSFFVLLTTDRGYDPAGVLTARVTLPGSAYPAAQRHALVGSILDRLSSTPGVVHAAFTSEIPLTPGGSTSAFTISPQTGVGETITVQASPRVVSARYFAAAGMRIVEGRDFADGDTETAPPVVVVNRALAKKFLNDRAVGIKVPMGAGYEQGLREATIVGIVDDVRYVAAADSSQPEIYFCYRQFGGRLPVSVVTLFVRTTEDPIALARPLRTAVREADGKLVAESILTMEERMLRGLARPRLYAIVLGGFAVSALLVAAVGLFGVLSYSVAQRSRELALRTALGASRADVLRLVFGQTMAITSVGIAVGVLASFALMQSIRALLHGVTPHDGATFILVPLLLLVVSAATCLPPSLKAARLDPLSALRA
jgi:predicted permease